jgi:FkbM family methyltransferase
VKNSDIKFFIPPSGIKTAHFLIKEIWKDLCYTKYYTIKKDDIIVDIGANVGVFTLLALSLGAKTYAFEPNPESFFVLKKNLLKNGFTDREGLYNVAVADIDGHVDLKVPLSNESWLVTSSEIMVERSRQFNEKRYRSIRTDSISFKTLIEKYVRQKIDLLKIDCEGAEYDILKDANLEDVKNISMETHDCYPEENLISILEKKNFIIQKWIRRMGKNKTGFCYALHSTTLNK